MNIEVTRDMTKGARFAFYLMLFFMGCTFWIMAELDIFEMSELVYGTQVLHMDARWWAVGMSAPSFAYLWALFVNGKRKWTPYVRLACGTIMICYFLTFVLSAYPAAGGDLMVIASGVMAIKATIMGSFDALDFRKKGRRNG